jgi:hypothetical protein
MAQAAVMRLVAGVCGIVLALATACSGINARTDSFNTLADARQAGAIELGRLPEGVPPGTRDIRIGYVPGSTERWGLFNFPQEEAPTLRALLQGNASMCPGESSGGRSRCAASWTGSGLGSPASRPT